jgi:gliding motility-associated-like protein
MTTTSSKSIYRSVFLLLSLLAFLPTQHLKAQIFGAGGINCVAKNNYVEVGVGRCGVYGTQGNPPGAWGYHPNVAAGLGFVCDYQSNGWGVAAAPGFNYCGDYFVPGSPVEGWSLTFNGFDYINTNTGCTTFNIPGSITRYADGFAADTIEWTGGVGGVTVFQRTVVPRDSLFFLTSVVICNTTAATVNNVYYGRNLDPDNEQPWTGSFVTTNVIVSQPAPPTTSNALVTSIGGANQCFLGLGTKDDRARVNHGGFGTIPADDLYFGVGRTTTVGASTTGDIGNGIGFNLGNLAPGECTCLSFVYVMNAAQLNSALSATYSVSVLADSVDISGSLSAVNCVGDSVLLSLSGGATSYAWTWSPAATLSDSTSLSVWAFPTTTTVYNVHGIDTTGGACAEVDLNITVNIEIPTPNAGPDGGACLGSPAAVGAPATAGYTYSWSPTTGVASPTSASTTVTLGTPGTYMYVVTETTPGGCSGTDTVYVTFSSPIASAGVDDTTCAGLPILIGTPATPGLTYSWSPGAGLSSTIIAQPTMTQYLGGTYTYIVTATSSSGCIDRDTVRIFVEVPFFSAGPDVSGCEDTDINIGSAPVAGATYSWSPTSGLSSSTVSNPTVNLPSGGTFEYILTGTTALGCVDMDTVEVTVQDPDPNGGPDRITCPYGPVTIGGPPIPGVTYSWSPSTYLSSTIVSNPTFSSTVVGSYTYIVTGTTSLGCIGTDTVVVTVDPLPLPPFDLSDETCVGEPAVAVYTGPPGPTLGFIWDFGPGASPGSASTSGPHNITWMTPGMKYVTLTMTVGACTTNTAIDSVMVWPIPVATITTPIPNQCLTGNSFSFSPGSTYAPGSTFLWTFGPGATPSSSTAEFPSGITFSTPGVKTVTLVVTEHGCTSAATSTTFTVYDLPDPNFNWTDICVGSPTSFTDLTPGATVAWTWNFDDGPSTSAVKNPTYTFSSVGQYDVNLLVVDGNGCSNDTTITVTIHPLPVPDFTYANKCFNTYTEFTNLSTLVDPYGSSITGYSWDFGDPASGVDNFSTLTNPTHAYPGPGVYSVTLTVTSNLGCVQTLIRTITVEEIFPVWVTPDTICQGESATLWAAGAIPGTEIVWFEGIGGSTPIATGEVFVTPPLAYTVTYYVCLIETATGCRSLYTPVQAVVVLPPHLDMQPSATVLEVPNAIVEFNLTGTPGFNYPLTILWNFGDGSTSTEYNPVHQYQMPGMYTVTLFLTDRFGCENELIWNELIEVKDMVRLHVPNAFTPNGDFINDEFMVETMLITQLHTEIYDRWGKVVYESENLAFRWNGRDSKGEDMPEGSYTYIMRGYTYMGSYVERKGSVMLMR